VSAETIQRNEREVLPGLADPTESRAAAWVPGDPGPLGLGMFGITTFVLSVINAHLVGSAVTPTVFGLALAGGGLAQLVAGIWEFRTGNTFGAVVFCSFAAFWISFYFLLHNSVPTIPKAEVDASLGLFLWAWTIYTGILFLAALRTSGALVVTFVLLIIALVLLSIGFSGGHESTIKLGGYFGIATAAAAWYTCGAALVNATWGRVVVPTFPLGT
jgi:succinate-acetate transporter protein